MSNTADTVIPIVALVASMSIPIFWFYFDSRNKASRDQAMSKAIESGAPLEEVKEAFAGDLAAKSSGKIPYRKGLILIALGVGLLISRELGFFGPSSSDDAGGAGVFGICGLLLGVALFVSDFFNRKRF